MGLEKLLYSLIKDRVFIIAEAGVNHNGDFDQACRLIDVAADCGADAVKFQTFKAENLVLPGTKKAAYQDANCGPEEDQFIMIKKLELAPGDFHRLNIYARKRGIIFISTPADVESVDLLEEVGVPFYKIGSADLTNVFLLKKIAGTGKDVIISTGMSDLIEVGQAVENLKNNGAGDLVLLHCTTAYPAPFDEVNLRAMESIKRTFRLPVGFSDHTLGCIVACGAVAMGARVLEKHFTLDSALPGPDHKASATPDILGEYTKAVRKLEVAMGDGIKRVTPTEADIRIVARKIIVAGRDICKGQTVTEGDLAMKRNSYGWGPEILNIVLGKKAVKDIKMDDVIDPGDFH